MPMSLSRGTIVMLPSIARNQPGVPERAADRLAVQENPGSPAIYRILAACYTHMERMAEAREAVAKSRAITPQVMSARCRGAFRSIASLLLSGLRLAAGQGSP
jgi:hypothetical protein